MNEGTDVLVVGAGVIGLAVGRALAQGGLEVIVLERHRLTGQETSSRNSGVIHSGIYYPRDSLKARLCVEGRELLYAYCTARQISHRRLGKIIVAQEEQIEALRDLHARGRRNGVSDLLWLGAREVRELEPQVSCAAGLLSPSTGILDVHELMQTLHADLESFGGAVAVDSELIAARPHRHHLIATVRSGADTVEIDCRWLINCAGLGALQLLSRIAGYPAGRLRPAHYAKGNYFSCRSRPFRHLVYPMPGEAGLGVHATLDLSGATRFGPDVEWVTSPSYDVDPARAELFYAAIRNYWPGIPQGSLQPDYAGVRPKLQAADRGVADFEIETPEVHQVPGLINLLGIESPGLTASLALAREVLDRITLAAQPVG